MASGPLVRSSYRAGEFFVEAMVKQDRQRGAALAAALGALGKEDGDSHVLSTSSGSHGSGGGRGESVRQQLGLEVGGVVVTVPELEW